MAPVVDLTSKPADQPAAATPPSKHADNTIPIAGGAVALLALGGAAYAVARRRRREDAWQDEWVDEPVTEDGPVIEQEPAAAELESNHDRMLHDEQPEIVAPSAFAWGATQTSGRKVDRDPDDDRLPGETWVQRAYRGPSTNNPSVSLKNRLGRAAFFDKRERDVAAGLAEPVDADAGLPDALTEDSASEIA